MFQHVQPAAPDAILGISEAYRADPRSEKISLAVGVYKDAGGRTPVLDVIKIAEQRLVETEASKTYLPIDGPPAYGAAVRRLLFGADHELATSGRARSAASPGGTGALRIAADYLKQNHPGASVWLTTPTWANHPAIFEAAGVPTKSYAWLDASGFALDIDAVLADLAKIPAGDAVLLHGCCHNPTGVDPTPAQWTQIADALAGRGVLPLLDFAYQGFGEGVHKDAQGLRTVAEKCSELFVCSSYSKNFGLYNDRVGALTVLAETEAAAETVMSRVKQAIRRNFSNPPAHGLSLVSIILDDPALNTQWQAELGTMRSRIQSMRESLKAGLDERGVSLSPDGNGFITKQLGMFTVSGLTKPQVQRLADDFGIYVVGSGRINVAGITPGNVANLCDAIAAVTRD
ncbi:MAG: amino acid aminotransferase [Planctomycetota bacterium]